MLTDGVKRNGLHEDQRRKKPEQTQTKVAKEDPDDDICICNKKKLRMLPMEVCQEQKERLGRSVVGEMLEPIDLVPLRKELLSEGNYIDEVSDLGAYKALITFESQVKANEVVSKNWEVLEKYFAEVRMWSNEEWSQTRRVWLECCGVPPQIWSNNNLKRIGEEWGTFVHLDNTTMIL